MSERSRSSSKSDGSAASTSSPAPAPAPVEQFNPGWSFYLAFAALAVLALMAALDATSLSVALPIMAKVLKGTAIEAFWSGTSFLLTTTIFQPVLGSLSHIFGRKPLIYISIVLFTVGAIICATANNFTVVLVGRSIQGIGAGGIICLTEIVITDMVPLRERGKWFSFLSAVWSVGTVTGPLLGGGFSESVSWRWIFWINLPFAAIGAIMIFAFLNLNYRTSSFLAKLRRVDWVGMALFISSLTGFLIPLTWGGIMYSWSSWRTLVPLIICAAGLVVFVVWEEYFAVEPMIRTSVFKNRTAAVNYIGTVLHGIILWSLLYYLPLYYEAVKGMSPIMAGVSMFPQTFTVAPAASIVGVAIALTGNYRYSLWAGWFLTTLGMGLLIYLKAETTTVEWVFINIVSGMGTGILFPAMAIAIQAAASVADQADAAATYSFLRAFGQTVGVAMGGVIFQNFLKRKLLTYPALAGMAAEYSQDASGLVQIIKAMPAGEIKDQLRVSYTEGLRYVWLIMCVMAAIGLVASLFSQQLSIDKEMGTEQGFKHQRSPSDEEKGGVQAA